MAESRRIDELLAVTRANYRAPPAARERVWSELAASGQLGVGVGAEGRGSNGVADAARRLPDARVTGVSKPMVALVAGLTFVAGFWLGGRPARAPLAPVSMPVFVPPRASAPSTSAPPSLPSPSLMPSDVASTLGAITARPATPPVERAAQRGRSTETAPSLKRQQQQQRQRQRQRATNAELALLQRADHALRSGEPELALSFLADLERRHPETQLGEERTAARLMARCARRDDEAVAAAERFLQDRRASVYADRVRELCGLPR